MLGKQDLAEIVRARNPELNRKQARQLVDEIFKAIRSALERGDRVTIPAFGTFSIVTRSAREGRNPATGQPIAISPSRNVKLKPARELKTSLSEDWGRGKHALRKNRMSEAPDHHLPGHIPNNLPGPTPYATVDVRYATDRKPISSNSSTRRYGSGRGDGSLEYGVCKVSIPLDHRMGRLEGPVWRKLEFRPDPKKHVVLLSVDRLPENRFFERLTKDLRKTTGRQILLFLHGFNVSFANAARRTAQIAYDLGFEGVPAFYSWPSKGSLSHAGYVHDSNNVEWTVPHLKQFLYALSASSGAESIHLVAHSMGNRALTRALEQLADAMTAADGPAFSEVVLTAPDIDADVFRQIAEKVCRSARRVTLYASERDRALRASHKFNGFPRAGDAGENVVVVRPVDTIDASAVDTNLVGHFYYADNRSVLSDVFHLLRDPRTPENRFGVKSRKCPAGGYWAFVP